MIKESLVLIILIAICICLLIWASTNWIKVNTTTVPLKSLPSALEGYRIVLLSDLHDSQFGKDQDYLLNTVAGQSPDIIAFVGDLIDGPHSNVEQALTFMGNLVKIAPVYYVEGNHEVAVRHFHILIEGLKERGINILHNKWESIAKSGEQITLAGVGEGYCRWNQLEQAIKDRPFMQNCIALSHNPNIVSLAAAQGVDLVLAGHHHGGQIRLPFLPALYAPPGQFFPQYDSGLYQKDQCWMYITRGLGHTGPLRFRFWNRPEVAVIKLAKL